MHQLPRDRGQKYLNSAKNQSGKGIGENPVKGYSRQLHRYKPRLKRPLHCLAGQVPNILPSPLALISKPSLLSHQNPKNIWLNRPLWPFWYFSMESYETETYLIVVQWDHALKIVISKALSPAQE